MIWIWRERIKASILSVKLMTVPVLYQDPVLPVPVVQTYIRKYGRSHCFAWLFSNYTYYVVYINIPFVIELYNVYRVTAITAPGSMLLIGLQIVFWM
jgi:hypothetical protein